MILQTSPQSDTGAQIKNGATTFVVIGWGNPQPITALIDPSEIEELRAQIAVDIDSLLPRCKNLHATLPPGTRERRAYRSSQRHEPFHPVVRSAAPFVPAMPSRIDPPPAIRHAGAGSCADGLGAILGAGARIVCVGEPSNANLRSALGDRAEGLIKVALSEGAPITTVSGRFRPSQEFIRRVDGSA